ncbi:MAG: SDR family oxidoreductase [Gammaproteobacteria bacterium]
MNLEAQRILITGAGGGIGRELCTLLALRKGRLCLVDRSQETGEHLRADLAKLPADLLNVQADITRAEDRERTINKMLQVWGGIDMVINLAGIMDFARFDEEDPGIIHRILEVNVAAPMQLTRSVLPQMIERGHGRIVNVGSMFGSIGFPCFAAYSASKFALRGFSQALRRELNGTGVGVTYVSPRAVKTPFNPPIVHRMAQLGMMHMDEPHWVAQRTVHAIEKEKDEAYLGFPESIFARINAVLPKIVTRSIIKQVPALISFTQQKAKA